MVAEQNVVYLLTLKFLFTHVLNVTYEYINVFIQLFTVFITKFL